MKDRLHLWKNKRFARLLFSNFLLWACVFGMLILCMMFLSHWYSVQNVYDQLGDINLQNAESKIVDIEKNLRDKQLMMLRLAENEDVKRYFWTEKLFETDYEQIQLKTRIYSYLVSYSAMDFSISTMFIYNEKTGEIIASDYGTVFDAIYRDIGWKEAYQRAKDGEAVGVLIRENDKEKVMTIIQRMPILHSVLSGVMVTNVDCRSFFDHMLGEDVYVVTTQEGEILSSRGFSTSDLTLENLSACWQEAGNHLIMVDGQHALVTVAQSPKYGWWIYSVDQMEAYYARIRGFDRITGLLVGFGLVLVLVFSYILSVHMFIPVKRILYVLQERKDEMIIPPHNQSGAHNELIYIADAVLHTLDRNRELTDILEERLQKLNQVRLRMLQGQVNPHFLYNTLASINWMVLEKLPEDNEISDALCSLSELLRERLKNTGFISFRQELEQVQRYVRLQQLCFQDAVVMGFTLTQDVYDCAVPSMILQTLVENAIKHGMDHTRNRSLHIEIAARVAQEELYLSVSDDGRGIEAEALHALRKTLDEDTAQQKAIGLYNVRQQLRLLFNDKAVMHVGGAVNEGFQVEITIPGIQIGDLKDSPDG